MNSEEARANRTPRDSPQERGEGSAPTIVTLLAEDNRVDVMLIREAIDTHGLAIDLHVASDGERACNFIEAADADPEAPCPELLVLDLNLPRRSGIEVLERLRRTGKCKNIPVLVVSSSDLSREREELSKLGVRRHFRKPTGWEDYMKIGEVLREILTEARLI